MTQTPSPEYSTPVSMPESTLVPVLMLPCAIATDIALARAMALVFARAGWDICVYFDVRSAGERAEAELSCAAVASLGRHAVALPADISGAGHPAGAAALIARCAHSEEGLGQLPRCLINAAAQIGSETLTATPMRIADGDIAPNNDGSLLMRLNEVNVAPALALTQALHHAWTQLDAMAMGSSKSKPDVSVINIIDSATADVHLDGIAFALTQVSLRAATPLLAKALAPDTRVVGVSTPLLPVVGGHNRVQLSNAICDAVLFVAEASTITGSVLLADGGAHLRRAERLADEAAARPNVATMSDRAPQIASDPHCK